ncbi:MAG: hypothetical protein OXN21_02840 [Chloroflexota bacterium]|nr:hypothetical protein [Chloroflexota bacterium]
MSTETANRHSDLSRRLIQQANYELDQKGDRVQACEKASGAVAQAVKAIAEDREWRHGSHNLRRTIVNLIAVEYNRPDLPAFHAIADVLHENFFEDRLHDWEIRPHLDQISGLLSQLWEIRERGPNPSFVPDSQQQQTIERLQLSNEEAAADPLIDYPPPLPPFESPDN